MPDPQESFQEQVASLRRTQILDAATTVFATQGFHCSTIRDIAKAAGVADGTIYNYFKNKTALLYGILERLNSSLSAEDNLAELEPADLRSFFRAFFRKQLEALGEEGLQALRIVIAEMLVNAELRALYLERIATPSFTQVAEPIEKLVEEGRLRTMDVPLLLRALNGLFLGIIVQRLMGDPLLEENWHTLPDYLTDLLLDGLLPR
jgi:AcrR family transcriptional regulator